MRSLQRLRSLRCKLPIGRRWQVRQAGEGQGLRHGQERRTQRRRTLLQYEGKKEKACSCSTSRGLALAGGTVVDAAAGRAGSAVDAAESAFGSARHVYGQLAADAAREPCRMVQHGDAAPVWQSGPERPFLSWPEGASEFVCPSSGARCLGSVFHVMSKCSFI